MTDAKIVSLKGEEIIPRGTARPDVVAALEEMLEMAKSGEIDGIAAALLLHDDCTTFRLNGRANRALIGVIRMMEFRLLYDDLRESE
jgi:hypothetical protein